MITNLVVREDYLTHILFACVLGNLLGQEDFYKTHEIKLEKSLPGCRDSPASTAASLGYVPHA